MKTVFVVTNTDNGWDCVVAVFSNEKAAEIYKRGRDHIIITEKKLEDECGSDWD
jgi:hypothetical protein